MKKHPKFTSVRFGADPELFLITHRGKFVSSVGRIGGSKESPRAIDRSGSAVQEDNVAVEFNTRPASTQKDFVKSILKPLTYLTKFVAGQNLQLRIVPSAIFTKEELMSPQAMTFGCDPDFNAWTGKENPPPQAIGRTKRLRTCGGHLHLSWKMPEPGEREEIIKALDLFLGVPSTFLDGDTLRRSLYGKAGAYRPKDYGVEYRVLSNFWIRSTQSIEWTYSQAQRALQFLMDGNTLDGEDKSLILKTINNNHKKSGERLIAKHDLSLLAG